MELLFSIFLCFNDCDVLHYRLNNKDDLIMQIALKVEHDIVNKILFPLYLK